MLQTSDLEFDRSDGFQLRTYALDIIPGKIMGILGPNGSGKSTFLQLMTGILKPRTGTITWGGKTRRQWGARPWAQRIAAVPQEAGSVPQMDVRHYVSLGLIPSAGIFGSTPPDGAEVVNEAMRICNVGQLSRRSVAELSGGQRQRVRIAKALTQTPHTLILDEPGNHLDLHAIEQLAQLLRRLADSGLAIVVSMHDIDLASQLTDDVVILSEGKTQAFGTTNEVLTPEVIKSCWGVDMLTLDDGERKRFLLRY